jgi:hypothetical protein
MKDLLLEYLCENVGSTIDLEQLLRIQAVLTEEDATKIVLSEFPFLIEKPLLRNRVEDVIFNRLTKTLPDDLEVSFSEFDELYNKVAGVIHNISHERLITGFTREDLESFMLLKLHQMMRRGQYNPAKNPGKLTSFYAVAFNNLITDLNRCKNRALNKCDSDALYDCLNIDTTKGQPFI